MENNDESEGVAPTIDPVLVAETVKTKENDDNELFQTYLVALFACRLDDVERTGSGLNETWKRRPVDACCSLSETEEMRAIMKPWLDGKVKLSASPLLRWFNDRPMNGVEDRRRANGIRSVLERSVRTGCYDARVRAALKLTAQDLKVSWSASVIKFENALAHELASAALTETSGRGAVKDGWSFTRIAQVTAAAALGGSLVALTAGAAIPVIAPIVGGVLATNAAASAALSLGLFGAAGAGLTGYKMADRTKRGLVEFFFERALRQPSPDDSAPSEGPYLHLVVSVSGGMNSADVEPVKRFWGQAMAYEEDSEGVASSDVFTLFYDRANIVAYSRTLKDLVADQIVSRAYGFFLKELLGRAFMAAVALPMSVAKASGMINNRFVLCERRSIDAGEELAHALRSNIQGARPVTLIGFGFGALTVFTALEALEREDAYGIVENVVVIGAPLKASENRWKQVRRVVAGGLFNCYCEEDWPLKLVMEWSMSSARVAGVQPVNVEGITDVKIGATHYDIGYDEGTKMQMILRSTLGE